MLATFPIDALGSAAGEVTIPADTTLGSHTVIISDDQDTGEAVNIGVTVVAADSGTSEDTTGAVVDTGSAADPGLAATGVSAGVISLGWIGLAVVLGGAVLLFVARRRAHAAGATGSQTGRSHRQ